MNSYWLIEMDIFIDGEIEGISIQQVEVSQDGFPPYHKIHSVLSEESPMPISIAFKNAQQISSECYFYFKGVFESRQNAE